MKRIFTQKKLTTRKLLLLALLLAVSSLHGFAQADCFEYYDEGKTIITGLTAAGRAAATLTIPKEVTTVKKNSFQDASLAPDNPFTNLTIEGNPYFELGALCNIDPEETNFKLQETLTEINLGNSMSVANMKSVFSSLGTRGALQTVEINGYNDTESNWKGINWTDLTDVLTGVLDNGTPDDMHDDIRAVDVIIPAALVYGQVFGNANVKGRFEITGGLELITFCGNVTFQDVDEGSNMLFYVADSYDKEKGSIHIQRVRYIAKGEGVLIHNLDNTSDHAALLRYSTEKETGTDASLYGKNMLKGVVEPTTIGATEEDGTYTNMVLYNGSFIRTSGGTLGANRAYLRMPTSNLKGVAANAKLSLSYDDDEATEISSIENSELRIENSDAPMYNLAGQKVSKNYKGIVIQNGKKYVVR